MTHNAGLNATPPPHHLTTSPPEFTGWLLDDALEALAGNAVMVIETAPPRPTGPLGAWRVLRCRAIENHDENPGAPRYELLAAREQMPEAALSIESSSGEFLNSQS